MSEQEWEKLQSWRARPPLSGTDLTDFLVLRQVCGGSDSEVYRVGDQYVEKGRPVLPFLDDGFTTLVDVGHLALDEPDPDSCALRRVLVTASGRARYEDLCDRQGVSPYPTTPISGECTE